MEKKCHNTDPLSGIKRLMDSIRSEIANLENMIKSGIAAVFFESHREDIDSSTSLAILQVYTTPEVIIESSIEYSIDDEKGQQRTF